MKSDRSKLTLDQPTTYQIQVPGQLGESWSDWAEGLTIQVVNQEDGEDITILSGTFDQAGLQGLLRRLYAMGLPLISVTWVRSDDDKSSAAKGIRND